MDIILCRENKKPLTDWAPATSKEIAAHGSLYAVLHPTNKLACIDIDEEKPWVLWAIEEELKEIRVPYELEKTPRPGWHIWLFCSHDIGRIVVHYLGTKLDIRTGNCYTIIRRPELLTRLLDSSREPPPMSFFHHLISSDQPLNYPLPARAGKTRYKKNHRRNTAKIWNNTGRNNKLSAGLYFALKMGNSTARHIRKALLDGLPADETNDTLEKKKQQRGRDIARREATLLQIEREKPLPRTRSHSLLKPVLRTLIDLGLHSGLCCAKRQTIASKLGCCIATVTRHTNRLMKLGYIAKIAKLDARVNRCSGWIYRTNIWAVIIHTRNCHTKALARLWAWKWRPAAALLPDFARRLLRAIPPRSPPPPTTTADSITIRHLL